MENLPDDPAICRDKDRAQGSADDKTAGQPIYTPEGCPEAPDETLCRT